MSLFKKFLVFCLFAFIPLLVICANIKRAQNNCFNGYDLGIYHQSLVEIGHSGNLNPYVTIRGIKIFNDHFDPIQILGAQLVRLGGYHLEASLIIEWFFWLSALGLLLWLRKPKTLSELFLLGIVFLGAKGILNALNYPIHASFWSLPLWVLIGYGIVYDKAKIIGMSCLGLCFFKEHLPVAILWFSFFFLFGKNKSLGVWLFLLGLSFSLFAFVARPILFGEIHGHGEHLVKPLLVEPVSFLWSKIIGFNYVQLIGIFAPLIALGGLSYYFLKSHKRQWACAGFFLLPLFGLHFLANSFGYQYSFQFSALIIAVAYFQGGLQAISKVPWATALLVLLAVFTSGRIYGEMFDVVALNKNHKCVISPEKTVATKLLKEKMKKVNLDQKVAATGGVVSILIRPGLKIYHIDSHSEKQPLYNYLLLEKNNTGDTYPINKETIEAIELRCRPLVIEILQEDDFYFFAKGIFSKECVHGPSFSKSL